MIVSTGLYYAAFLVGGGLLLGTFTRPWAAIPFGILALFCLWFFRDPERTAPTAAGIAVSPADGKVVLIRPEPDGRTRMAIFLNVFDVHVNRSPIAGRVASVQYKPGKFLVASEVAASVENEQNTLVVEGDGTRLEFSQIAGLIARRIVCDKKPGDMVQRGERIGLIKFGSRVDLLFGPEWALAAQVGERVVAGESILAKKK
ncbi:MAG: phosphatidylserine decarboxylase [Bryobacteraceae bacterium]|nr:phosphatidylserine decarboxylase [Bryobacteraceae bacterium]